MQVYIIYLFLVKCSFSHLFFEQNRDVLQASGLFAQSEVLLIEFSLSSVAQTKWINQECQLT